MKKVLLIWLLSVTAISAEAQNKEDLQEKILLQILEADIKFPLIVLKQAIHESGNFNSPAAKHRNNIFGWRNGRMRFRSFSDCIIFYKTWQDKYYKGGDYYKFLKKVG